MPQQVLPTETDFEWFKGELLKREFQSITEAERAMFRRLKMASPRLGKGREEGFTFSANELTVWVWTTWLPRERRAREVDAGWVVIAKKDNALYFSHPLNRTKNFLVNLFRQAWIAKFRVENRPCCPDCGAFMEIVRGKQLKDRYWRCDQVRAHRNGRRKSFPWDVGLPRKAQAYVNALRQKRRAYEAKAIAAGKNPYAAMLKRKPWCAKKQA